MICQLPKSSILEGKLLLVLRTVESECTATDLFLIDKRVLHVSIKYYDFTHPYLVTSEVGAT